MSMEKTALIIIDIMRHHQRHLNKDSRTKVSLKDQQKNIQNTQVNDQASQIFGFYLQKKTNI